MKSGSGEAFHVLAACHRIPPACRIRRMLSQAIAAIQAAARYSASLAKLQVLKAQVTGAAPGDPADLPPSALTESLRPAPRSKGS